MIRILTLALLSGAWTMTTATANTTKVTVPNTTLQMELITPVKADSPWTHRVKFEQMDKGKVVYTAENVEAYITQNGKWVVHFKQIRLSPRPGDRITTDKGDVLQITKASLLAQGEKRMLETVPIVAAKK